MRSELAKARVVALLLLASLVAGCAGSPAVPVEPLPALVAFLRAAHPDPYRFVSEAQLDATLDAEVLGLSGDPDPVSLARAASRVVAVIGDAHIAVGLGPDVVNGPQVPFLLKRAGGRVFLDASTSPMPLGTEVVHVEGVPADEFLARLADLVTVDGRRPAVRAAEAERRFSFLALLELGPRSSYEITIRRPGGEPELMTLAATDREGLSQLHATRQSAPLWGSAVTPGEPPWPTLTRVDESTQLLRLASFGMEDDAPYDERLVLDLRGNEGGNRMLGVSVLRRLLDEPFTQWASISTRVRAIPRGFRDLVTFPIAPESALRGFPGERRGDWWVVDGDPLAERMVPVDNPHPGPLTVFVDDATNSAAVELLAALLAHREGVQVIGTETQGACERHTGQLPVVFQSGDLAAFVSLFEIELVPIPGCEPGRGVMPDVELSYSADDFLEGRDPFLAALP